MYTFDFLFSPRQPLNDGWLRQLGWSPVKTQQEDQETDRNTMMDKPV